MDLSSSNLSYDDDGYNICPVPSPWVLTRYREILKELVMKSCQASSAANELCASLARRLLMGRTRRPPTV